MKNKFKFEYLIYIVLIMGLIFLDGYSSTYIKKQLKANFFLAIILPILIKIVIGLLLGADYFIGQLKQEGTWKINISKIVLMAIPSLYLGLATFIYYGNIPIISFPIEMLFKSISMNLMSIFQLIFGHSIITSFYKNDNKI